MARIALLRVARALRRVQMYTVRGLLLFKNGMIWMRSAVAVRHEECRWKIDSSRCLEVAYIMPIEVGIG